MREYKIKFDIFGKKLIWTVKARTEERALTLHKEWLLSKMTVDTITSEKIEDKQKPEKEFNKKFNFDNFDDIFSSFNVFGSNNNVEKTDFFEFMKKNEDCLKNKDKK